MMLARSARMVAAGSGGPGDRLRRCGRNAFSLLELLVAIAVIAVLVGILVPTLGRARFMAKEALCNANLHQIGLGWTMYLGEKEYFGFPGAFDWAGVDWYDDAVSGIVSPERPLNPYIGSELREQARAEIFLCPLDDGARYANDDRRLDYWFAEQSNAEDAVDRRVYAQVGNSYRANEWMWTVIGAVGWSFSGSPTTTPRNKPEMAMDPSRFILVGDWGPFVAGRYTREGRTAAGVVYGWWHEHEECSMLFLDGSARTLPMQPGTAATRDYHFYLDPVRQPANSWVYASSPAGTPPAPTHIFAPEQDE